MVILCFVPPSLQPSQSIPRLGLLCITFYTSSVEPSGDTDEATNPDELTQVNAHHTSRFQCNHEFTGFDIVAYLGEGSSNHSPGPMEVFKTQADDKSISIYDNGRLPLLLISKAQITMQGMQVPCSSTSTFLPWIKSIRTT